MVVGALGPIPKCLVWELEELEIRGREHPNYSIVEVGQNTEKSPKDLRRLVFTRTPVRDHQPTLV